MKNNICIFYILSLCLIFVSCKDSYQNRKQITPESFKTTSAIQKRITKQFWIQNAEKLKLDEESLEHLLELDLGSLQDKTDYFFSKKPDLQAKIKNLNLVRDAAIREYFQDDQLFLVYKRLESSNGPKGTIDDFFTYSNKD